MRLKRPVFCRISAQEMSEANRRMARTPRATRPVCARISKMLPTRMAFRRKRMSVSLGESNFYGQIERSTGVVHGQKEKDAGVLGEDGWGEEGGDLTQRTLRKCAEVAEKRNGSGVATIR